ncbi:hypothetical protein BUALT_BualtUnG0032300 [Buddleja alternifolia]|nr:hypothetical protein BUALT_BualtUnG0032300 [Buddleja alternifolia]
MAARATLIQAVTTAMPTHVMHRAWLPTGICNHLDKINRTFLWSRNGNAWKLHTVKWETVTKAKQFGGLGLKDMRRLNTSLLAKVVEKEMDALDSVFDPLRDFAKDSVRLVKRCHKPDRKEFTKVATRTAIGFVVMGFVGFFVKLIFIPINNIIVGAT